MLFAIENQRLAMRNGYNGRRQKTSSPLKATRLGQMLVWRVVRRQPEIASKIGFFSWMIFLPGK